MDKTVSVVPPVPIDTKKFEEHWEVPAVLLPATRTDKFIKSFRSYLLNKERQPNVIRHPDDETLRIILLNQKFGENGNNPPELEEFVTEDPAVTFITHTLGHNYSDYSWDEALKVVMKGVQVPSGFETIGNIAFLNLREAQLPYRFLIGQVILDKLANIKTVVNKTDRLQN
jgi:tRNA (guanine37-N1)-methyltransferase